MRVKVRKGRRTEPKPREEKQMQTTFANPANARRVTIGITNDNGARVEIVLTKTTPAPYAPLAPVFEPTAADTAEMSAHFANCETRAGDEIFGGE